MKYKIVFTLVVLFLFSEWIGLVVLSYHNDPPEHVDWINSICAGSTVFILVMAITAGIFGVSYAAVGLLKDMRNK